VTARPLAPRPSQRIFTVETGSEHNQARTIRGTERQPRPPGDDAKTMHTVCRICLAGCGVEVTKIVATGGPDAIASYWGNPAGNGSSNVMFMNGFLDAVGTHNPYYVGSVDQNAMHVVATAMYGSMHLRR